MAAQGQVDVAEVRLWNHLVGAVRWDLGLEVAVFEYAPRFVASGIELSPLRMPLRKGTYSFPTLKRSEDFQGLPGLLADVLPDHWGTKLYQLWLSERGRSIGDVTPVERLCYIGRRAMGALQFEPADHPEGTASELDISELSEFAHRVLDRKAQTTATLNAKDKQALASILKVGTSAGGNRAKAVIAWDPATNKVVSGETDVKSPYEHWILKFDDMGEGQDAQPQGYGRIELAYHFMAKAAGIAMSDCRLWEENGRAHFMTRRFDRTKEGGRLHYQSLAALLHLDHNLSQHAYEQIFEVVLALKLSYQDREQLFRRMVFNVAARNQDDHTKNFGFLMDPTGRWSLAPAFDLTFSYNPEGRWTHSHQMSVAGKRQDIRREDLVKVGEAFSIKKLEKVVDEVVDAVATWPEAAGRAGVEKAKAGGIEKLLGVKDLKRGRGV